MMVATRLSAAIVALSLAIAPVAHAQRIGPVEEVSEEGRVRLGVLPTVVTGTEQAQVHAGAPRAVDGALAHGAFEHASLEAELPPGADVYCADPQCWQWLAGHHFVSHLLQLSIAFEDPDWAVEAILVDGDDGRVLARVARTCDLCGFDELEGVVADVAAGMRRKLEASMVGPPLLVVHSTPSGAMVRIDGEPAGATPLELPLEPGQHDIRIQHEGFITERQRVAVVDGVRNAVSVSLRPLSEPARARGDRSARGMQVAGAVGLGMGIALLGVGIALLVLEDRPIERDCRGDEVDPDGNCKWLYDTLAGGAAATAVGGALTVTGVTLLVLGRKRRARAELQAAPGGLRLRF